jgi:hypothetical protein
MSPGTPFDNPSPKEKQVMTRFPLHSAETAPEAARPILSNVERGFGFVPNLIRVMAASPAMEVGQEFWCSRHPLESPIALGW